jgi:hypothetical protein
LISSTNSLAGQNPDDTVGLFSSGSGRIFSDDFAWPAQPGDETQFTSVLTQDERVSTTQVVTGTSPPVCLAAC